MDLDDNGQINILDAIDLSNVYGTSGSPINKTSLLLELQDKIDSLNASLLGLEANLEIRIPILEASVGELESKVATLQTTINTLESRIATLESPGYMKAPAYDSGWLAISPGQNIWLQHNLNKDPAKLFIYVLGNGGAMVNQIFLGSDYFYTGTDVGRQGLFVWGMSSMNMAVSRCLQDGYWDQVRVQIWIIQ
jgi:uncharacterized small protein (DUF1192 family)